MKRIEIYENGINIVFEITDENEAKLLHFSALPFDEAKTASYMGLKTFRPVEIQASGIDRPDERHGNKYIVTAPGWRMKFKDFRDVNNDHGRKLELVTFDEDTGLEAVSHYQFYTFSSITPFNASSSPMPISFPLKPICIRSLPFMSRSQMWIHSLSSFISIASSAIWSSSASFSCRL